MTRRENTKDVTVVIPSELHRTARGRIEDSFDTIVIDRPDPALIPEERRASVRGLAASLKPAWIEVIDALPNLEIATNFGVGYDSEVTSHAVERGVVVTHTPTVLDEEVADTAVALLLNTLREYPRAERYLREGRWASEGDYPLTPLTLRQRTIGIYGLGRIGKAAARRLAAFDVAVEYHNRRRADDVDWPYHETLAGLARSVDTLISIVPETAETRHTVTADILRALGPSGVFINLGRGSVVEEAVLIAALRDGVIAAAGLDVFADEPHVPVELLEMENVCLLPHVASASQHTRALMSDLVADNLSSWFTRGHSLTPVPEAKSLAGNRFR